MTDTPPLTSEAIFNELATAPPPPTFDTTSTRGIRLPQTASFLRSMEHVAIAEMRDFGLDPEIHGNPIRSLLGEEDPFMRKLRDAVFRASHADAFGNAPQIIQIGNRVRLASQPSTRYNLAGLPLELMGTVRRAGLLDIPSWRVNFDQWGSYDVPAINLELMP